MSPKPEEPKAPLIRTAEPSLGPLEERYLLEAFRSTCLSGNFGPHISLFEEKFAVIAGCSHAISMANGTVSMQIILRALDLQYGEEVLCPDLTYAATAASVIAAGGTPVLVDCDEYGCICAEGIRAACTPATRFVWVVHLYGHPCDMDSIQAVSEECGLIVLEDAAEAHGALYKGRPVGSFGLAASFSFFANKIITTGEGGMVTTNDKRLADRVRLLSRHAMSSTQRFHHVEPGFNFRLSNLLCAVGLAQCERFADIFARRSNVINAYRQRLDRVCGVSINPQKSECEAAPWLACVVLPARLMPFRDAICADLFQKWQIETRPFFVPCSAMACYAHCATATRDGRGHACEKSALLGKSGFNLPTSSEMPLVDVERVVDAVIIVLSSYDGMSSTAIASMALNEGMSTSPNCARPPASHPIATPAAHTAQQESVVSIAAAAAAHTNVNSDGVEATRASTVSNDLRLPSVPVPVLSALAQASLVTSDPIRVLGAGGHAKVVIATCRALYGPDAVAALYDVDPSLVGTTVSGVEVLPESQLPNGSRAVLALGSNALRRKLDQKHTSLRWLTLIHPNACVDSTATLGEGTVVFAGAVIQAYARLGRHTIVNTRASVDHECVIGDYATVAPAATLCGNVRVGTESYICAGATVRDGLSIAAGCTLGMGAALTRSMPDDAETWVGVPAKPMSRRGVEDLS